MIVCRKIRDTGMCSGKDTRKLPQVLQNIMHLWIPLVKQVQPMSHNTTNVLHNIVSTRHFQCDSNTPQLDDFADEDRLESTWFLCFHEVSVKHYPKRDFGNKISFVEYCIFNNFNAF